MLDKYSISNCELSLRWPLYLAIGSAIAILSAFSLSASVSTDWSCGTNTGTHALTCGYNINYQLISIGLVLAFLDLTLFILAQKGKEERLPVWETDEQKWLRKIGTRLILIGGIPAFFGFFELNTTMKGCTTLGCTPSVLWSVYGAYEILMYVGLAVVIFGAFLVLVSRFKELKPLASIAKSSSQQ